MEVGRDKPSRHAPFRSVSDLKGMQNISQPSTLPKHTYLFISSSPWVFFSSHFPSKSAINFEFVNSPNKSQFKHMTTASALGLRSFTAWSFGCCCCFCCCWCYCYCCCCVVFIVVVSLFHGMKKSDQNCKMDSTSKANGTKETFVVAKWKVREFFCFFSLKEYYSMTLI